MNSSYDRVNEMLRWRQQAQPKSFLIIVPHLGIDVENMAIITNDALLPNLARFTLIMPIR